jgi:large subunit ribosomal protein L10
MSKVIKDLMAKDLTRRWQGVKDGVVVKVVGIPANETVELRKQLRQKDIHLMVVKTSLARRAATGTPLQGAFDGHVGPLAFMWGSTDMVALAKEAARLHKAKELAAFEALGGIMDGEPLSAARVQEISTWPTREEQLSILMGQIRSPGARLMGALLGPGALLASQIKKCGEAETASETEVTSEAEATPEAESPQA